MKLLVAGAVAIAVFTAAPKKKGGGNETMKGAIKDAAAVPPTTDADGGTAPKREPPPGSPDIEKLPFTPLSIQQVVAFYAPQIQACYEETLAQKDKAVEGKLMTSFIITPEGYVKKAAVVKKGTTVKEGKLNDCVLVVLGTMMFPKPPDGKDHPIEYPFNLKAIQ